MKSNNLVENPPHQNARAIPTLTKEENALILNVIQNLTEHLPQPYAVLATVAVLWVQTAWQVNKGGGFPPAK